ncbi:metallophosphoesterase family protein [Paenibacillus segetis]|uniref:Calcineurin-like phosphoesterase domain-containing protein n=1 Tax=Paenibacillus segetis TaxID=1325360 RepID=A0ABQ1YUK8_9BACL|nr:metallophosphoesterase [Paenibacillus segetis]GGH36628.1 hypothetical protein GCM10008013_43620 [Paenibacillus segetis]
MSTTVQFTKEQETKTFYNEKQIYSEQRPWIGELPVTNGKDFTFAVLGDRCGIAIPGVFEKALTTVHALQPDFVVSVGDLIEGYLDDEQLAHMQWEHMEALLQEIKLPVFQTIGNHDCGSALMSKVWRERKGLDYYAYRIGRVLFLVVNTEEVPQTMTQEMEVGFRQISELVKHDPEQVIAMMHQHFDQGNSEGNAHQTVNNVLSEEQIAFFTEVLRENEDVTWTFVTMHTPMWKGNDAGFGKLTELLSTRKHTMLAGHFHELEFTGPSDHARIQMGRTGAIPHKSSKGDIQHILWVTVKDGIPSFQVIGLDGIYTIQHFEL